MRGILVALALWLLCACAGGPATVTQTKQVEGVTIAFEHPQAATLLQSYELIVTLRDANQQPIEGADVALALAMPAMTMGTNKPVAEALGNGRYRITNAYNMDGDWIITVFVETQGKRIQAQFDQVVKPQQ